MLFFNLLHIQAFLGANNSFLKVHQKFKTQNSILKSQKEEDLRAAFNV